MDSPLSLRDQVKLSITAVLAPFSNGVTLKKFLSEYRELEGRVLPVRDLGYDSPIALLRSLTDAVRIRELPNGEQLLQGIPSEKAAHVFKFVQGQSKKSNKSFQHVKKLLGSSPPVMSRGARASTFSAKPPSYVVNGPASVPLLKTQPREPRNLTAAPAGFPINDVFIFERKASSQASVSNANWTTKLLDLLKEFTYGVPVDRLETLYKKKFAEKFPLTLDQFLEKAPLMTIFEIKKMVGSNGTALYLIKSDPDKTQATSPEIGIPDDVKLKVQNAIAAHKDGILLGDFLNTYRFVNNEPLDAASMGFPSLIEFLEALDEEVIRLVQTTGNSIKILPLRYRADLTSCEKTSNGYFWKPNEKTPLQQLPESILQGQVFPVVLGTILHPGNFWWKLASSVEVITKLEKEMTIFYENPVNQSLSVLSNEAFVGGTFAVKSSRGPYWQRAVINSSLINSEYQVRFLDHGTLEKVKLSQFRHLLVRFASLPAQAKKSRLYDVKPASPAWPRETVEEFKAILQNGGITCRLINIENAEESIVELLRNGANVADFLAAKGLVETAGEVSQKIEKDLVKEHDLPNGSKLQIAQFGEKKFLTSESVAALSTRWDSLDIMKRQLNMKYLQYVFICRDNEHPELFEQLKRSAGNEIELLPLSYAMQIFAFYGTNCSEIFNLLKEEMNPSK